MSTRPARQGTALDRPGGPGTGVPATARGPDPPDASGPPVATLAVPEVFAATGGSPRGLAPAEAAARPAREAPTSFPR
ncbi:hypothetical protein [Streptomyces sp. NPDC048720]|uniref:hypothetical protein n=1 Tax=Streptomyces sp. NPDC048720 TaxID=3365588 RepID=UPI003723D4DD